MLKDEQGKLWGEQRWVLYKKDECVGACICWFKWSGFLEQRWAAVEFQYWTQPRRTAHMLQPQRFLTALTPHPPRQITALISYSELWKWLQSKLIMMLNMQNRTCTHPHTHIHTFTRLHTQIHKALILPHKTLLANVSQCDTRALTFFSLLHFSFFHNLSWLPFWQVHILSPSTIKLPFISSPFYCFSLSFFYNLCGFASLTLPPPCWAPLRLTWIDFFFYCYTQKLQK